MRKYAIILAGGIGSRHGGLVPKQFVMLDERPVLWWSMKRFYDEDSETVLIVVMHPEFYGRWKELFTQLPESEQYVHYLCNGGVSRTDSVKSGIEKILELEAGEDNVEESKDITGSMVAVHDAARPLVSSEVISRGWQNVSEGIAVIPVISVTSSLRLLESSGVNKCDFSDIKSEPFDRSRVVEVQTPQIFMLEDLVRIYQEPLPGSFTDDGSLAQLRGMKIQLVAGGTINFKITNPEDSVIAELLIKKNFK